MKTHSLATAATWAAAFAASVTLAACQPERSAGAPDVRPDATATTEQARTHAADAAITVAVHAAPFVAAFRDAAAQGRRVLGIQIRTGGDGAWDDQCLPATDCGRPASPDFVIPAKAGTQSVRRLTPLWVPAFAGMTKLWDDGRGVRQNHDYPSTQLRRG